MQVKKIYGEGEGCTERAVMGGGRRRGKVLLHNRIFITVATKREIGRKRETLFLKKIIYLFINPFKIIPQSF